MYKGCTFVKSDARLYSLLRVLHQVSKYQSTKRTKTALLYSLVRVSQICWVILFMDSVTQESPMLFAPTDKHVTSEQSWNTVACQLSANDFENFTHGKISCRESYPLYGFTHVGECTCYATSEQSWDTDEHISLPKSRLKAQLVELHIMMTLRIWW